jgi:hypothetical protein
MDNPFAPLPVSAATPGGAFWREGDVLRSTHGAVWPSRCVVCGQECSSDNPLHLQLQWHPRWIYVFIVISLWIYLIAAAVMRRRAAIDVFLCDEHMIRRRNGTRITLAAVVLGLATMFGGFAMDYVGLAGVGMGVLLVGVIVGTLMMRTMRVIRIEQDQLWLKPSAAFMETVA